jgi:3-oxoacyl-[acyl-carrier-protein] synthase II
MLDLSMSPRRRVVVTGLGTVNPLAVSVPDYWRGLLAGKSGIGPITRFDTAEYKVKFAGEVKGFDPTGIVEPRELRRLDRFTQYAMVAAREALADSGLDLGKLDPFRGGVIIGSGIGGIDEFEDGVGVLNAKGPNRVSAFVIPKMIANAAAGNISIKWGLRGPNTTVATACSSAAHALGDAMRQIAYGFADVMVSGGSEAGLARIGLAGFINCKALSENNADPAGASRPFDKGRDGFVLGEGAWMVVVEREERARARGAHIYATIDGYASTCDAYHRVQMDPDGHEIVRCMQTAVARSGRALDDIGYVNYHGTSTQLNDAVEARCTRRAFGALAERLAGSSTKSMIGHPQGASGAAGVVTSALALDRGFLPPTINLRDQDPACDLDFLPGEGRASRPAAALCNCLGFGSKNSALVLGAVA